MLACRNAPLPNRQFTVLNSSKTGLYFANKLTSTDSFNLFKYMYFYNGAGVGGGDFNNDGQIDLFFASNQGANTLYLSKGKLQYEDVTKKAGIVSDGGWSTGVSVIDINNDGLLDIYVCRVGNYRSLHSANQLLVCTGIDSYGIPHFKDKAAEYGLNFSGFGTQAAFFDYDADGDLDVFLLNHSVHENGSFRPRQDFEGSFNPLSGDRLYRNDGGKYTDVSQQAGINSTAIGYGLGIVVSDLNMDGYPDMYVGNDFHENDYLYINQKDGTFKEQAPDATMHTSQYSMGVDAGDINNDGLPEIISVDMLPADPYVLKRSLGEDEYDIFHRKISSGYHYQFTRNNLQLNRGNGLYSEVGLYSGIAATDWSWAPLWFDFDNDGLKDLFISNGIPKRMNDIDYINFISDQEVQQKIQDNRISETDAVLIDKFPRIKLPNKFFRNKGNLQFQDIESEVGHNEPTYSNGALYADLDNDGDLDVVVNNIEDGVLIYKNECRENTGAAYKRVVLKGDKNNRNAIGAKVFVYNGDSLQLYEKYPVHGFQSSFEAPIHIGLKTRRADSAVVVWPDNTHERINIHDTAITLTLTYRPQLPKFNYNSVSQHNQPANYSFTNITSASQMLYRHRENAFVEFDREPLLPHMLSAEGPAIAVADINNDGLDDVFAGASKGYKAAIFLQQKNGTFLKKASPNIEADSTYEDTGACWADVNNDGNKDLVVSSGGNEYYGEDKYLLPRVYLNDGKANFSTHKGAFSNVYITASSVVPHDFNNDGYIDLFVAGRAAPNMYGQVPESFLLQNDKTGRFVDVTAKWSKDLKKPGFVNQAVWSDIDKDGDADLLLAMEWNSIVAFINNGQQFTKKILCDYQGWWNTVLPFDADNDGDIDILAGNLGTNSRIKASSKENVRLYVYDFDGNGKNDEVLTYFLQGKEIPFANKSELDKQMPVLKKKFLLAEDFANATLADMFSQDKLKASQKYNANWFESILLLNDGQMNYKVLMLPWQAQLAPVKAAAIVDANKDGLPDVLLGGNYYENNIEMGRYDSDYGTLLLNSGSGKFTASGITSFAIKGQVRGIHSINVQNKNAFLFARNNDSLLLVAQQ